MTNRDLLKEAIADAKAVKEVAITNAKAALEEAFTPHLKEMFERKMKDMEDKDDEMKTEAEETGMSELELEELLRELDETEEPMMEAEEEEEETEEEESEEKEGEEKDEEEVEIDLEDMTEEDLKKFIEEVVDEMIEAGELEAGHEGMEDEAGAMEEPEEGPEEAPAEEEMPAMEEAKKDHQQKQTEKMRAMESELTEAMRTINTLKSELHEINLLNSKLLYTNKIFKAKNLTESQKVKVLTAFDKAESVKEVKLVFETLNEGLEKVAKKELVRESKGYASKPIGSSPKQPVVEVNPIFERMKKLAGL
tara:strand:+ start:5408 stop:6331 length:924 start_codon:yes stop_codon:yes gene_type:complete